MTDALVRLEDYTPANYTVAHTELVFRLHPTHTTVEARLQLQRQGSAAHMQFHGVGLDLQSIAVNGNAVPTTAYHYDGELLTLHDLPEQAELHTVVTINPSANTVLEGLYMSNGMYCTQCEAEGFRRITFFPDRPDVLSRYTVTLWGEKAAYPLLLANGNLVATGSEGSQHWATWEDPFPKPSYLFAVVAGDLACLTSHYTTAEGREVALKIYAEERDLPKLEHAMQSLKAAMAWDEKVYGLCYDLDLYMVVAVSHFNLGAMENKGLNIFNTACVLAHPSTTTDQGFQRVEAVIGHEYFHNWSGNRVTCRDWFQLSLKEGFTVFREQRFCEDSNDAAVKRVEDVKLLKAMQFPEDQGPLAHPVLPTSYRDIDNFYTATTYEKGAELVRMQWELLGEKTFLRGAALFFERFDGQAVTVAEFLACMEEASGRSLAQFKRWYTQAGTPQLTLTDTYVDGVYTLTAKQHTAPTPGQPQKQPLHIPLRMALLDSGGEAVALDDEGNLEGVWEITTAEESRSWRLAQRPTPSLLRRFSAPVALGYAYTVEQLLTLLQNDTDGYVRWQAAQELYQQAIVAEPNPSLLAAMVPVFKQLLAQAQGQEALTALLLQMPSVNELGAQLNPVDYTAVHARRAAFAAELGTALEEQWRACILPPSNAPYRANAESVGLRDLQRVALQYLCAAQAEGVSGLLQRLYQQANNMTERADALRLLWHYQGAGAEALLAQAYAAALPEPLVMDLWFALQATRPSAEALLEIGALLEHEQFSWTSPNRVRAVLGQLAQHNPVLFHRADGACYALWCQAVGRVDGLNPQMAARLLTALTGMQRLPAAQRALLVAQLEQLKSQGLSKQSHDVVVQLLAE